MINAQVGGNLELSCLVVGQLANIEKRWRRADGAPLPDRHDDRGDTLYLISVDRNDAGVYVCEGFNPSGSIVFTVPTGEVRVSDPPRVHLEPPRQVVRPGENPVITCHATGEQPIDITWTREGAQLPSNVRTSGGSLQVNNSVFCNIKISKSSLFLSSGVSP